MEIIPHPTSTVISRSRELTLWALIQDEEVTFQDMEKGNYESKAGFKKIQGTCMRAARQGYQWVWIDTMCIDKTSSAELSEAVSTFKCTPRSKRNLIRRSLDQLDVCLV